MATNATPPSVYPLSNKEGVAIPLDVARPITGLYSTQVALDARIEHPIAANDLVLLSVSSSQLAELIVNNSSGDIANFIMMPNVIYDLAVSSPLAGNVYIYNRSEQTSTLVINVIQRWTQLNSQNYGVS